MSDAIASLVSLLDQGYNHKAWHGANLRSTIRRVDSADAARRPSADRHSIAEHVLHAAYWKYSVRRRLTGERRGSFAIKGHGWFTVDPADYDPARWNADKRLLDGEHALLRAAVMGFDENLLGRVPVDSKTTYLALIQGIAFHDVYHAAQISLLKRLIGVTK